MRGLSPSPHERQLRLATSWEHHRVNSTSSFQEKVTKKKNLKLCYINIDSTVLIYLVGSILSLGSELGDELTLGLRETLGSKLGDELVLGLRETDGLSLGCELTLGCEERLGCKLGCELGDVLTLGCKLGNELGCELGD
eukprot:scaffold34879_cov155-Skeletonema_dohrnii-CCMP3373.AAC.1